MPTTIVRPTKEPQLLWRRPELAHVRLLVPVLLRSAHLVLPTPQIDAGHIRPQHLQCPRTLVLPAAALVHGLSPSTPYDSFCLCVGTPARVGNAKESDVGESLQASLASERLLARTQTILGACSNSEIRGLAAAASPLMLAHPASLFQTE